MKMQAETETRWMVLGADGRHLSLGRTEPSEAEVMATSETLNPHQRAVGGRRHGLTDTGCSRRKAARAIAMTTPLSRRSSGPSKSNWTGPGFGKPVAKPKPPSSNKPTASITRAAGIPHSAAKALWPLTAREPKQTNERSRYVTDPVCWRVL